MRREGVPFVVAWPADAPPRCLPAMALARAFFAALRQPGVLPGEAFALAEHVAQAHCARLRSGDEVAEPRLPTLLADDEPAAPAPAAPPAEGAAPPGAPEGLPGYEDLRLLAPHAELRLMVAGLPSLVCAHRLGHLCRALRGFLAAEARALEVVACVPLPRPPGALPPGTGAVRAEVRTASGAVAAAVLAGPPALLADAAVVRHALRQALAADALALQLKLPQAGTALPPARCSPGVAAGAPCVEALAVGSTWAVPVLKALAADRRRRLLGSLGVAAVSAAPVASLDAHDAARLTAVLTDNNPAEVAAAMAAEGRVSLAMIAGAAGAPALAAAAGGEGSGAAGAATPFVDGGVAAEAGGSAGAAWPAAEAAAAPMDS